MSIPKVVATRLPVWALTSVTFIIVAYIGVLGGVAIWSDRDVKFWPPEIGKGPKSLLISELKEARLELRRIKIGAESEISVSNTRLNEVRTNQSQASEDKIIESMEWRDQVEAIEKDLSRYETKIVDKLEDFESYIKEIEFELKEIEFELKEIEFELKEI